MLSIKSKVNKSLDLDKIANQYTGQNVTFLQLNLNNNITSYAPDNSVKESDINRIDNNFAGESIKGYGVLHFTTKNFDIMMTRVNEFGGLYSIKGDTIYLEEFASKMTKFTMKLEELKNTIGIQKNEEENFGKDPEKIYKTWLSANIGLISEGYELSDAIAAYKDENGDAPNYVVFKKVFDEMRSKKNFGKISDMEKWTKNKELSKELSELLDNKGTSDKKLLDQIRQLAQEYECRDEKNFSSESKMDIIKKNKSKIKLEDDDDNPTFTKETLEFFKKYDITAADLDSFITSENFSSESIDVKDEATAREYGEALARDVFGDQFDQKIFDGVFASALEECGDDWSAVANYLKNCYTKGNKNFSKENKMKNFSERLSALEESVGITPSAGLNETPKEEVVVKPETSEEANEIVSTEQAESTPAPVEPMNLSTPYPKNTNPSAKNAVENWIKSLTNDQMEKIKRILKSEDGSQALSEALSKIAPYNFSDPEAPKTPACPKCGKDPCECDHLKTLKLEFGDLMTDEELNEISNEAKEFTKYPEQYGNETEQIHAFSAWLENSRFNDFCKEALFKAFCNR